MVCVYIYISDGFRKVSHPEQNVLSKVQVSEPVEFCHPNFKRGHPELLHLVQRRVSPYNHTAISGGRFGTILYANFIA